MSETYVRHGHSSVYSVQKTDKRTKKHKQTREPICKGDSHTGLIAFHIQLTPAALASLT